MITCIHCHQPQSAAPVICPKCYEELTVKTVSMDDKKLADALRCCNIYTGHKNCGECPVCATEEIGCTEMMPFAADRIEALTAQLTASERDRAAALEFIRHIDSEYGRYITDAGFERWRGSQEAGEGGG